MFRRGLLFLIIPLVVTGCSDSNPLALEHTILACNAGQETNREKCKAAEKAQGENIKGFVEKFF